MQVVHRDEHVQVTLGANYVAMRLEHVQRVVSFALYNGGFHRSRTVAIHEVTNSDLPLEVDPREVLAARMQQFDAGGVGMLTSRRVAAFEVATARYEDCSARVLVTAGLSNAVRVGDEPGPLEAWGTINVICHVAAPLSDVALLEALSIVAEARTSAVLDSEVASRRSGLPATGTGTDCIAVIAPEASDASDYAGKHTAVGHLVGDAARRGVASAIEAWKREYGR
jgi:adenosylcobinamide amidohydrolase